MGIQPFNTMRRCGVAVAILAAALSVVGCGGTDSEDNGDPTGQRPSTAAIVPSDTTPPTTPTGLKGVLITPTQIDLNWTRSRDNVSVTGYRVYRNGVLLATLGDVAMYSDTTVVASTTYSYTVQARDAAGNASGQSPAVIVVTPATLDTVAPSPPTGLTANAVSGSQINLSWSASTDNVAVTGYRVFRNGTLLLNLGNVTSYLDPFLTTGATYVYTVQAFDAAANSSAQSAAVSATTLSGLDTIPPSTPTGLSATAASTFQINLTWTASTDNVAVANYRVYRNGALLLSAGDPPYQDSGLAAATTYTYNIDAVDSSGNISGLSAGASATTLTAPDTTAPSIPLGLTATAISSSQINLSWLASDDNVAVTGYRVFRGGVLVATLGNVTAYQDTGLTPATAYSYRIRAFDGSGNVSGQSSSRSATTLAVADTVAPTTPTGLSASAFSSSKINLSWSASTDNVAVTGYRVYRNGAFLVTLGSSSTVYQDTALNASTTYTYLVDAIDGAGNASGLSSSSAATTLAPNTAALEWNAVTFPTLSGYRVYFGTASGNYQQAPGAGVNVGNVTNFTVTGLGNATTYFFAVTAYDGSNNESGYSNEVFKIIP
jgi:chitodextrinase